MAKLRKKQQRARRASTRSSRSECRTTDSPGPRTLPVTHGQSAFHTQRQRYPTDQDMRGASGSAVVENNAHPGHQTEPAAIPSNDQPAKRRKYFSLPTKSKPSFKGPTELASVKAQAVEPSAKKQRPVSAPSPAGKLFKAPPDTDPPNPRPKATPRVHFATDENLARFAGTVKAQDASSERIQALRALASGPTTKARSHVADNARPTPQKRKPQPVPQPHPQG